MQLGHRIMMSGSGRRFASHVLMDTQINLARTAFFTGENGKAVKLLSKYLQWFVDDFGPHFCARCLQMIDPEAPMLKCGACRVARCVFTATSLPCGTDCHACRAVADSEAWMGVRAWRLVAKGKAAAESAWEEMFEFLWTDVGGVLKTVTVGGRTMAAPSAGVRPRAPAQTAATSEKRFGLKLRLRKKLRLRLRLRFGDCVHTW